ncbi:OLC1v1015162C1 [Oldenlandia corymbosa var. corymbosa]|uniref:Exocyst subunit Exo70 family protein n=1 Tax=Oldenlandia corymbosa var. corymbosa TaxID=529605 RepID=A0AAV1E2P2_OLDCO|nr:OLC1v1015162C1 [Oldenlandia corymbosa var. corymbosa]
MFKKASLLYNFVMGSSQSRESAVALINQWNSEPRELLIFDKGRDEASQYLQAVVKIQQTASAEELQQIIPMAINRLKLEFQRVLNRQGESYLTVSNTITELSTTTITDISYYQSRYEDFVMYEAPTTEVVDYLRKIAEIMNACGHLEACIDVYISVRKPFVRIIFDRLRLDELKAGDTKKFLSEELKVRIERWIGATKACVPKLFLKEKLFAEQIFSGLGRTSTHVECFLNVVKDVAVSLFSFAESVSLSRQSSERLNVVLILYDAMLSLMPDVNSLFPLDQTGKGIGNSFAATCSKLGDEIGRMLSDFEDVVLNEISTISNNDGGRVHQLTKNVVGYINVITNYKTVLMKLLQSRPSKIVQDKKLPDDLLRDPKSLTPLSLHLVLIIAVLQLNLDNKSKYYKEASLGHLFMMNNVNYIVLKSKESQVLQDLIGVDYLNKLNGYVKGAMISYQDLTCGILLKCLEEEGIYVTQCCTSRVSTGTLRSNVRNFNAAFEKIKSLQSSWEVPDPSLREELRRSMLNRLKPEYERFLERHKNHFESTNFFQQAQKTDVKYTVQDLQVLIEENLFSRSGS